MSGANEGDVKCTNQGPGGDYVNNMMNSVASANLTACLLGGSAAIICSDVTSTGSSVTVVFSTSSCSMTMYNSLFVGNGVLMAGFVSGSGMTCDTQLVLTAPTSSPVNYACSLYPAPATSIALSQLCCAAPPPSSPVVVSTSPPRTIVRKKSPPPPLRSPSPSPVLASPPVLTLIASPPPVPVSSPSPPVPAFSPPVPVHSPSPPVPASSPPPPLRAPPPLLAPPPFRAPPIVVSPPPAATCKDYTLYIEVTWNAMLPAVTAASATSVLCPKFYTAVANIMKSAGLAPQRYYSNSSLANGCSIVNQAPNQSPPARVFYKANFDCMTAAQWKSIVNSWSTAAFVKAAGLLCRSCVNYGEPTDITTVCAGQLSELKDPAYCSSTFP